MSTHRAAASAPHAKKGRGVERKIHKPRTDSTLQHEMIGDRDELGEPIGVCLWCGVRSTWAAAKAPCPGGHRKTLIEREERKLEARRAKREASEGSRPGASCKRPTSRR